MTDPIKDSLIRFMPPGSCLKVGEADESLMLCKPDDYKPQDAAKGLVVIQPGADLQHKAKLWREQIQVDAAQSAKPLIPADIPPPKNPSARMIYDLATQLDDLDIRINVKLPVTGLREEGRKTTIKLEAMLKEGGALIYLGADMKPSVEVPLWDVGTKIPLLSPFFKVKLLKLSLNEDRQIEARVCYLFVPFNYGAHDRVIEQIKKNGVPQELLQNERVDWGQNVPLYSWQILDSLYEFKQAMDKQAQPDPTFSKVEPLWGDGSLDIQGNFSNKTVNFNGLRLDFAELENKKHHRITVHGPLTSPVITVNGLARLTFGTKDQLLHFTNSDPYKFPWIIQAVWDPDNKRKPVFNIPKFASDQIYIESALNNGKERLVRLDMEEGIEIEKLKVDLNGEHPRMTIRKLTARKIAFDGFGTKLSTDNGNVAVMENLSLSLNPRQPVFSADSRSKASGSISYFLDNQEKGHLIFDFIKEAVGQIRIGPDETGQTRVEIKGEMEARLPLVRLLVRSEKMKAYAKTEIEEASVQFNGSLAVWPYLGEIEISGNGAQKAIHVEGSKGHVRFGQNANEVKEWADELSKLLPEELIPFAKTDIRIDISRIFFDFTKLKLSSTVLRSDEKPALQINEALMGPIQVEGTLKKAQFLLRLPGGLFLPVDLTRDWNQSPAGKKRRPRESALTSQWNVSIRLDQLKDQANNGHDGDEGKRRIEFKSVDFLFEETLDTFSQRDARRCGATRQHIHAQVKDFFLYPSERDFGFTGIKHAHVVLKSPLGQGPNGSSGCLVVD